MEKLNRTIKRIAALAGGAVMVGAALSGALAQIDKLPTPFITSAGVMDSYVVVGTMGWNPDLAFNAAAATGLASDVAIGIDVGAAFAQKATSAAGGGASGTIAGGTMVEKAGNALNYEEGIDDVDGTFDDTDMSVLLKDGTYKETKGETNNDGTYTQRLTFTAAGTEVVIDKNDDDKAGQYLFVDSTVTPTYTYKIHFDNPIQYDDTSSATMKEDFKGTKLSILDKAYTLSDVSDTGAGGLVDGITLLSGALTATQGEYTTQTYTLGDTDYEIEVLIIADVPQTVKFKVNGETTDALAAGDIYELSDGTEISVDEVMPNEGSEAAGADQCTFFLGANKVALVDTDAVKINDQDLEDEGYDTLVTFTYSGATDWITDIAIDVTPNDDKFIAAGEWFQDPVFQNWGLYLGGFEAGTTDIIKATTNGDDGKITFVNNAGKNIELTTWHDDVSGDVVLGDEDYYGLIEDTGAAALQIGMMTDDATEGAGGASTCDGAVVSDCEGVTFIATSAAGEIHVIKITDISDAGLVTATVDLKDLTTGKTYNDQPAATASTIDLGFMTIALDAQAPANGDIQVVTSDLFDTTDLTLAAVTKENAGITIENIVGWGTDGGEAAVGLDIWYDQFAADPDSTIIEDETGGAVGDDTVILEPLAADVNMVPTEKDSDWSVGSYGTEATPVDDWGTWWYWNNDAKDSLTITYYSELRDSAGVLADLFIAPYGGAVAGGTSGAVNVNYINAATGIARTDADFASAVPTKNVILIGGPYVNELVSDLAAADKTDAAADYVADTAIVQYITDAFGTNDALVIAGYAAKDTKLAGQVVAANMLQGQFADKMTGDKVTINTAGATTVSGVTFA